ncbi:hypothetical protein EI94DRAFT_1727894 [Lactarius quietus]|nr:hypothetical protein EI94DRAFT_1727894 [Lactarius quietus]
MDTFVVFLLLAFFLLPLPTPARPTAHMRVALQIAPTRMDADVIFGIAFSLALIFALLGSFAWLATGRTITQLFESLFRMSSALITFAQRLSDFAFSLIERAWATFINAICANRPNAARRGGPSLPVATVRRVRAQSGTRGRFGGTQGNGSPSAFIIIITPFTPFYDLGAP